MAEVPVLPRRRRLGGADDGFAVLETVIVTPILILVLLVAVAAGRLESARLDVDTAAGAAARAASLARSPAAAAAAAGAEAARSLSAAGVSCPHPRVGVDTSAFRPGGVVRVTVTCRAELGDLVGMGFLPLDTGITKSSASPIDRYRQAAAGGSR
ncbi:pilus assembly protein [Catenulispora sp. NL8]|uniref:Pilus assembly protein n=1 Tax=Catenulispora pinistramenti TaxID=2705254 RepID=A0ABS5KGR1_9ACTN|nr:TadE/TadG family type IV pilus assembly protein [Catenulispora pinistramenti]MBS2545491.1 pilus assembly protein [Catenulispora pinistramenti]